jgi:hypothetical protein
MADDLVKALEGMDIEVNVGLDDDRAHISGVLVAYVKAADHCRELFRRPFATVGECSTAADTFDAARANLARALEGQDGPATEPQGFGQHGES